MQRKRTRAESSWSPDEAGQDALRFISEQAFVPLDQLGRHLDVEDRRLRDLLTDLHANGCCRLESFAGEAVPWVWLTAAGARVSGTGLPHRQQAPALRSLARRRAINEVRLQLAQREPDGRWADRRGARRRAAGQPREPDAIFEVGVERHAIEVEASQKKRWEYLKGWRLNSERFDSIIHFCEKDVAEYLRGLRGSGAWPKVMVEELPAPVRQVKSEPPRPPRSPQANELVVLRFIAEQGGVRADQIGRLPNLGDISRRDLVDDLCDANLIMRRTYSEREPAWLYNTFVGNRLSGTRLQWFRPGPRGVRENYALNELRIHLTTRLPEARWLSRRSLKDSHGHKTPHLPGAVLGFGGRRLAINFKASGTNTKVAVERAEVQGSEYDAVVFVCGSAEARRHMEYLRLRHEWSRVVIRDMPRSEELRPTGRPVEDVVRTLLADAV